MSANVMMGLSLPWTLAVATFAMAQLLLLVYAAHRLVTVSRWAQRSRAAQAPALPADLPVVTVQLPLYNERAVVERLIDAAAELDWPADRLEIQVLDDSGDDTTALARCAVERWRERGRTIVLIHRDERRGYKAGALADGLARSSGELVAVFDADFVPPPDFLLRVVPHFNDPVVGMVQARWGHLNRDRSILTRAQATLLDAHFCIEHEARMAAGLFFNFNGTAGVWRRRCVEESGGWSHDTLTEDLDLSYRAQLAGWRFALAPDAEVPGELPSSVLALKSQQRRWAKGSIQTARKLLPTILQSALPLELKAEATLHLTANAAYVLMLVAALLLPAVLAVPSSLPPALAMAADLAALAAGVLPVGIFLFAGQRATGSPRSLALADVARALLVGAGLSVNNAIAVLGGLLPKVGDWERTPKTGERGPDFGPTAYRSRPDAATALELALSLSFALAAAWAWSSGHPRATPFLFLMSGGLGLIAHLSLSERWRARRDDASPAQVARLPEHA